ncbi:beta-N-acetylglucosaminidase (EC 3.2.1.52) [uncultured Gammaproteobacteria bacterium]|uniref:beta-N-acetylhexosaminidase n=1 Tax=Bathymodiolus heckerae thiotrophic gill symbiont TaxID=1052212 RepID=UPI0010B0E8BA|nr:beta-N-acetylhexosaminidase [Bathymodiolus heckerae thiotrophic gill symbiont]CAC9599587.1 beta-N-acetylglucosaminidase (EC 3.2.1.52) [uncultured Gammaproteobacteria bacterium]SHN92929.1 Beta N-acetyl-glucosaminidase [Bathymodiolus heckerae thiotrophic gill symbiont]
MKLGPIMMDVSALTLTKTEILKLAKPSIGGVILFGRNFETIDQVKKLINSIREVNPDLLISVDHEGGRVQRFRKGFTHLPAMAKLGDYYDRDPELAKNLAFSCGFVLAYELLDIGVDFSFAPVLDVDYGQSSVIGDRAFHSNPEAISILAGSLIAGMHEAGMKCVGKHFPGHGFVAADSHLDLPIDDRSMTELLADMSPFKDLTNHGLDGVMPAHVVYPQVDDKPAGFSKKWIKDILQDQIGFGGVVFSDDLSMQGAFFVEKIQDRVRVSLESGCDMVLICNHSEMVDEVINDNWGANEKLQLMQGYKHFNCDKMMHSNHLDNIRDLL